MPPFRPSPLEVRELVRETLAGAGLTEVVTTALVSPRHVEALRRSDEPVAVGRRRAASPAASRSRVDEPAVARPLDPAPNAARQPARRRARPTCATAREDVAVFEIGKGYARDGDEPREWWRLGFALVGRGRAAGLEPARRGPTTSTTPRACSSCSPRGWASRRPSYAAASRARPCSTRAGRLARDDRRPPARARRRAPPVDRRRVGAADRRRRDRRRGGDRRASRAAGWRPSARPRSAASRRSSATSRSSSPRRRRRPTVEAVDPGRAAASCCATRRLFDIYRGMPLDGRREEPRLPAAAPAADRTLTEAEIERAVGGDRRRPAGGRRAPPRLTGVTRAGAHRRARSRPRRWSDPASHCGARSAAATLRRSLARQRAPASRHRGTCVDISPTS